MTKVISTCISSAKGYGSANSWEVVCIQDFVTRDYNL